MSRSRSAHRRTLRAGLLLAFGLVVAALPASARTILLSPGSSGDESDVGASHVQWDAFGSSSERSALSIFPRSMQVRLASGDAVSLSKTQDFFPAPSALLCTFDIMLSGVSSSRVAAQNFRVGSRFSTDNLDERAPDTYAVLSLNTMGTDSEFQLRDAMSGRNSVTFVGTQAITWALNHSGARLTYSAPDGSTESIANNRMDVWVGRVKVFDDAAVVNPSGSMTDVKWFWDSGEGTTRFSNFMIRDLPRADGAVAGANDPAPAIAAPAPAEAAVSPALELYRPTPNPFAQKMRLAYAVERGVERVDIGVYDVAGRRLRGLVEGLQGAGQYEVSWDGRIEGGSRARSGIYFLRAAIGATRRVIRVVYLVE